jgi:uncharacterized protein
MRLKSTTVVLRLALAASPVAIASLAAAQEAPRLESVGLITESQSNFITAEIADTDALRARGLMFRHRLPEGQGMLFDFEKPRPASMWMKDTYMSLDMIFIRADGSIAAIAENTVPKSVDVISVEEPVKGVLELTAGSAKKFGLKKDDQIIHPIFENKIK